MQPSLTMNLKVSILVYSFVTVVRAHNDECTCPYAGRLSSIPPLLTANNKQDFICFSYDIIGGSHDWKEYLHVFLLPLSPALQSVLMLPSE